MSGVLTKLPPATAAETERSQPHRRRAFWTYGRLLFLVFLLTLPFVNPWVRGDGVGYYAYVRSLLIDHDLHFEDEWAAGNLSFRMNRVDGQGRVSPVEYTSKGYVANHYTVGPSLLWAPFLVVTHGVVVMLDHMGAHIPADGYSRPYRLTMALTTACYGFTGLWLSFCLARSYVGEQWALLATLGLWFGSSLPVYMYFNPSWSHAQSAFVVALFLWYWQRTRRARTVRQWVVLGLLGGLLVDVYYPNGVLLLVPALEALADYWRVWRRAPRDWQRVWYMFAGHLAFLLAALVGFLPTLLTRWILYGSFFTVGAYAGLRWDWTAPALGQVLFSSNHGLFSWTPLLLLAVAGLFFLIRLDRQFGLLLLAVFLGFYYVLSSYEDWHGISSYGNRLFVSLTPLFILGLAAGAQRFGSWFAHASRGLAAASLVVSLLVLWNLGLIFQWGTLMIPARGPVSWRTVAYNQVTVVPAAFLRTARSYLGARGSLMQEIEREDVERLKQPAGGSDKKR